MRNERARVHILLARVTSYTILTTTRITTSSSIRHMHVTCGGRTKNRKSKCGEGACREGGPGGAGRAGLAFNIAGRTPGPAGSLGDGWDQVVTQMALARRG